MATMTAKNPDLYLVSDDLNTFDANKIIKKTCMKLREKGIRIRCISEISEIYQSYGNIKNIFVGAANPELISSLNREVAEERDNLAYITFTS